MHLLALWIGSGWGSLPSSSNGQRGTPLRQGLSVNHCLINSFISLKTSSLWSGLNGLAREGSPVLKSIPAYYPLDKDENPLLKLGRVPDRAADLSSLPDVDPSSLLFQLSNLKALCTASV